LSTGSERLLAIDVERATARRLRDEADRYVAVHVISVAFFGLMVRPCASCCAG
jgi:hypothetical protein